MYSTITLRLFILITIKDTITYFTVMVGIVRAGYTAFPISPRNSPAAIAHLLSKTKVSHVFVGVEQAMHDLVAASLKVMEEPGDKKPETSVMPLFEEIYKPLTESFELLSVEKPALETTAIILHSSGSSLFR